MVSSSLKALLPWKPHVHQAPCVLFLTLCSLNSNIRCQHGPTLSFRFILWKDTYSVSV